MLRLGVEGPAYRYLALVERLVWVTIGDREHSRGQRTVWRDSRPLCKAKPGLDGIQAFTALESADQLTNNLFILSDAREQHGVNIVLPPTTSTPARTPLGSKSLPTPVSHRCWDAALWPNT
jgi:hypothetical protein